MHARQLVELAPLVVAYSHQTLKHGLPVDINAAEQYWVASKSRLDRWYHAIKDWSQRSKLEQSTEEQSHRLLVALLEEVITSEILTRVYAAFCHVHDQHALCDELAPLGQSVFLGHMEAVNRGLNFLLDETFLDNVARVRLNQLRQRAERWTDLLVGYILPLADVRQFTHDAERAEDFAADMAERQRRLQNQFWMLVQGAFHASFVGALEPISFSGDLNDEIASAVVATFSEELENCHDLPQPFWLLRLLHMTTEVETTIEHLLASYNDYRLCQRTEKRADNLTDKLRRFRRW